MTIEEDVITAMAAVASGRVYPNEAPADAAYPLVIVRIIDAQPLMTLLGYAGHTKSVIDFESWADTRAAAVTTRLAVQAAIDAAFPTLGGVRESPDESGHDPEHEKFLEPCRYSFWHP